MCPVRSVTYVSGRSPCSRKSADLLSANNVGIFVETPKVFNVKTQADG
jgi:hypothetical protein